MIKKFNEKNNRVMTHKVKQQIESGLKLFSKYSFSVDDEYRAQFKHQYRIYVYSFIKNLEDFKLRIVLSYEYFLDDSFSLSIMVLDQHKNLLMDHQILPIVQEAVAEYELKSSFSKNTYEKIDVAYQVVDEFLMRLNDYFENFS